MVVNRKNWRSGVHPNIIFCSPCNTSWAPDLLKLSHLNSWSASQLLAHWQCSAVPRRSIWEAWARLTLHMRTLWSWKHHKLRLTETSFLLNCLENAHTAVKPAACTQPELSHGKLCCGRKGVVGTCLVGVQLLEPDAGKQSCAQEH